MIEGMIGSPEIANTEFQGPMHKKTTRVSRFVHLASGLWWALRDYFGSLGRRTNEPVNDRAGLRRFLETRASYVAQTSLYGYLRTRAGMVYPQLFDDDEFVRSINIAKWHIWLACLSDLSIYTGGLLAQRSQASSPEVGEFMKNLVAAILHETGTPVDAGEDFSAHAARVQARLADCDWTRVGDDETPFSQSPTALIRWAPVVDNLKELDEEIVRNSVRFRWQEVRRDLRSNLDAEAILQAAR
jgi:hypothetical protein